LIAKPTSSNSEKPSPGIYHDIIEDAVVLFYDGIWARRGLLKCTADLYVFSLLLTALARLEGVPPVHDLLQRLVADGVLLEILGYAIYTRSESTDVFRSLLQLVLLISRHELGPIASALNTSYHHDDAVMDGFGWLQSCSVLCRQGEGIEAAFCNLLAEDSAWRCISVAALEAYMMVSIISYMYQTGKPEMINID